MAITRIADSTTLVPGKWLCLEPVLNDGICSEPRKIIRVAGLRVYVVARDGSEKFRPIKSVAFVCDTEAEGMTLVDIQKSQLQALADVRAEHQKKVDDLLSRK